MSNAADKVTGAKKKIVYYGIQTEEKETTGSVLEGIKNSEFNICLQFIVDNKTKKFVLSEAHSRWDNLQKGIIGPKIQIGHMETA